MQLPFLKNKNKYQGGGTMATKPVEKPDDAALMDGVLQEFADAVHKRDLGSIKESMRAIIQYIQMEDMEQDKEDMK